MRTHPDGGVQDAWTKSVFVGKGVSVALGKVGCISVNDAVGVSLSEAATVNVAVGKLNEVVGEIGVGVACGGSVSERASEMPPITKITETRAMMTPPPNCRKFCIISPLSSWRSAIAR